MDFMEKPEFFKELKKAAKQLGSRINIENEDDVLMLEGYWDNLKEYSFKLIKAAIQNAIRSRDKDSSYYFRAMITVPEIRVEAQQLLKEGMISKKEHCELCDDMGWILINNSEGKQVAQRCQCIPKKV